MFELNNNIVKAFQLPSGQWWVALQRLVPGLFMAVVVAVVLSLVLHRFLCWNYGSDYLEQIFSSLLWYMRSAPKVCVWGGVVERVVTAVAGELVPAEIGRAAGARHAAGAE